MADISKFNYYDSGKTKVIKPTDRMVISSGGLAFEGATDNNYETELAVVDPTDDRTITFPNATGNVLIDSQDLSLSDNVKIKLGTGGDLEIFHNGTNSIIKDTADSGNSNIKYLAGTQTFQNKDANKTMAVFNAASSIDLHYNGNKKFETTSTGIQTTGTVNINNAYTLPSSDGNNGQVLTTNGSGTISFSSLPESIIVELSIPGIDVQTDTNAFRFNCPYGLTVTGLDLYLDQHSTSGNVTVTVTNTTDPVTNDNSEISAGAENVSAFVFDTGTTLSDIVDAINAIGTNSADLIAILEALREAGALRAQMIII